ncbi:hypothetical protein BTO20_00800 [Mycobacterium dioxanotrophicus]|uniref:DUF202 domain-containing protein n=1 Tax=Mycobacterium dioxanotrophicus TaxID=482462 RepID=A0A1Y0BWP8_9MYCO|nr:DUF202 domain-containing protein [Mycobacterium dioxanotrophicus]ART67329.1 hypothetical protein BTO20_00800 [Mycobacterium dioxanotrophicus]
MANTHIDSPAVDYRFTLANERTYLAWIRTAMAFLAGGVAVVHLMPETMGANLGPAVGIPLFLLAIGISCSSLRRWRLNNEAIERNGELPKTSMVLTVAVVITGLGLAGLAVMIFTSVTHV